MAIHVSIMLTFVTGRRFDKANKLKTTRRLQSKSNKLKTANVWKMMSLRQSTSFVALCMLPPRSCQKHCTCHNKRILVALVVAFAGPYVASFRVFCSARTASAVAKPWKLIAHSQQFICCAEKLLSTATPSLSPLKDNMIQAAAMKEAMCKRGDKGHCVFSRCAKSTTTALTISRPLSGWQMAACFHWQQWQQLQLLKKPLQQTGHAVMAVHVGTMSKGLVLSRSHLVRVTVTDEQCGSDATERFSFLSLQEQVRRVCLPVWVFTYEYLHNGNSCCFCRSLSVSFSVEKNSHTCKMKIPHRCQPNVGQANIQLFKFSHGTPIDDLPVTLPVETVKNIIFVVDQLPAS